MPLTFYSPGGSNSPACHFPESEKNQKQVYNINLTSSNILTSDFFYLRNNDLIYIQPLKFKGFKKSQSQLLLSALTTFAVLFNVYLKFSE